MRPTLSDLCPSESVKTNTSLNILAAALCQHSLHLLSFHF